MLHPVYFIRFSLLNKTTSTIIISPHGIAMPKGLYFTAVGFLSFFFLSFFFSRLISEVTERISTKLIYIFTYDCYFEKFGEISLNNSSTKFI